jgi:hypothetical protein
MCQMLHRLGHKIEKPPLPMTDIRIHKAEQTELGLSRANSYDMPQTHNYSKINLHHSTTINIPGLRPSRNIIRIRNRSTLHTRRIDRDLGRVLRSWEYTSEEEVFGDVRGGLIEYCVDR